VQASIIFLALAFSMLLAFMFQSGTYTMSACKLSVDEFTLSCRNLIEGQSALLDIPLSDLELPNPD
jgi:hypothetical protein